MKHIVGVAEMRMSGSPDDVLVAHALGSSLGIALHDPVAVVGGVLHVMLPLSTVDPDRAARNPFMFVDTALPAFLEEAFAAGATRENIALKIAGGSDIRQNPGERFAIGKRNYWSVHFDFTNSPHSGILPGRRIVCLSGETRM